MIYYYACVDKAFSVVEVFPVNSNDNIVLKCEEHTIILAKKGTEIVRGNFPSKGFDYVRELDIFIEPRFSRNWTVNSETYKWEPPYPMPELTQSQIDDDFKYQWSDEQHELNGNGWILVEE